MKRKVGAFKGKRRRGYFLKTEKFTKRRSKTFSQIRRSEYVVKLKDYVLESLERPVQTSTPLKFKRFRVISTSSRKKSKLHSPFSKRARFISPVLHVADKHTLLESIVKPSRRSLKFEGSVKIQSSKNSDFEYFEDSSTVLYSDEADTSTASYSGETSFLSNHEKEKLIKEYLETPNENETLADESFENIKEQSSELKLCQLALNALDKNNLKDEFLKFFELVSCDKFPVDNVTFRLFLDVVKLLNCSDTRTMRYNTTTLNFFWLGKRLFGSRFLRFMGGPKSETQLLQGNIHLEPTDVKINFAVPSAHILDNYNPLGFHLSSENGAGLNHNMIDLAAKTNKDSKSYVISFDGKKVKRGGERDLLGFEDNPLSERRQAYAEDLAAVSSAMLKVQNIIEVNDSGKELEESTKIDLIECLRACILLFSKYTMTLRKLRKRKENALANYKEKVAKDQSLAKTLQFAMDSCRTSMYQAENTLSTLMDVQLSICRAGAYLNGSLELFANRNGAVDLELQKNIKLLNAGYDENTATSQIKQRTPKWYKDREKAMVTGSTLHTAVGCSGLKKIKQHFDHVVSGVDREAPTEIQRKAMEYGTSAEVHQVATFSSIIAPFLFPSLAFNEEGYYIKNGVIVSPDGSIRDETGRVVLAFEGKAPSMKTKSPDPIQHYKVPERYIIQTLFEQDVLEAEKGTLYMCWTKESTTLFRVPPSPGIVESVNEIVNDLYKPQVLKRPVNRPSGVKDLNASIKQHVLECEFLGEYPSITAVTSVASQSRACSIDTERDIRSFHDLILAMHKAKKAMKECYDLETIPATQVLVYLLADLDRLWKPEIPHAIPVMHCYRGYSLSMEIARNLVEKCVTACSDKGLHIAAVSSDGEFIQLMVQGNEGQPLTLRQLSKQVWDRVCKMKKNDLIKLIKSVNTDYKITKNVSGITVESTDNVFNLKTPTRGWKKKENKMGQLQETATTPSSSLSSNVTVESPDTEDVEMPVSNEDQDDTIVYDFEALLTEDNHPKMNIGPKEAQDICYLLRDLKPLKWENTSPEKITEILRYSIKTFLKDELLAIAKYLNLKLRGSKHEISIKKAKKVDLMKEISDVLQVQVEISIKTTTERKRKNKTRQPKSLRDLSSAVLTKSGYPKQVLNIAYAEYIWPGEVKMFRNKGRVANTISVIDPYTLDEFKFEPYYTPPYEKDFMVFTYDKTHMGTNLRKCLCLDKVQGIRIDAWKTVSRIRPDVLHPTVIEVNDGKIMDQMKESLARTMVSEAVEDEMRSLGYDPEATFCKLIRKGLYEADDMPGVPAYDRCLNRFRLISWLQEEVHFGRFPPYGGLIKGMSHILYEGLRTSLEAKLYLYAISNSGTYCGRAPNTLCSESFFGTMQEMDPWGQGILSIKGVEKHLNDFTTITSMKMDETRNIYIKTKKSTAYPNPSVIEDVESDISDTSLTCECRCRGFISCIIPRNHFFDTPARARLQKREKPYQPGKTDKLRGEQPVRTRYGYKINEAKLLPSKRLAVHLPSDNDDVVD